MSDTFTYDNNEDIREFVEKYMLDKKDFENVFFNCEYYETRNSWGHRGEVRIPTQCSGVVKDKIKYYNRTWERYTYQSLLLRLLDKYATYLTGMDFNYIVTLDENEIKDMKELSKKDFLEKHKYFSPKIYNTTKKYFESKGVI